MLRQSIVGIAVLATIATLAWAIYLHAGEPPRLRLVTAMYGGDSGLETVRHPERVTAFRLDRPADSHGEIGIEQYQVAAPEVDVPQAASDSLAKALLNHHSYAWDFAKACMPIYGARIVFTRGPNEVEVNFCMHCDILLVRRNGQVTGGEDFDPIHGVVRDQLKALFPNDAAIQGIE